MPQLGFTNAGVASPLVGPARLFTPAGGASLDPEALLLGSEAGPPLAALRFGVLTLCRAKTHPATQSPVLVTVLDFVALAEKGSG